MLLQLDAAVSSDKLHVTVNQLTVRQVSCSVLQPRLPRAAGARYGHRLQRREPVAGPGGGQVQARGRDVVRGRVLGHCNPRPPPRPRTRVQAAARGGVAAAEAAAGVVAASVAQPRLPLEPRVDGLQLLLLAEVLLLQPPHHLLGLGQLLQEFRRNGGGGRTN